MESTDKKIATLAKSISESMGYCLLANITNTAIDAEDKFNIKIEQSNLTNLFFESVYFSIDHIIKRLQNNFPTNEKVMLKNELHKNMLDWINTTCFSSEKNPIGYQEKIGIIYYDTLIDRDSAYSDPKNEGKNVFREILSEEFKNAGLNVNKSFFDSLSTSIIERLDSMSLIK